MADLLKVINLRHATSMVVGSIIGASIFVQPSEISQNIPSISGVLIVWLICGILTLFGSLICAELASIFTKTGGIYVYLNEAFSPLIGFLWGWSMFWVINSGIIAAVAVIFARYCSTFYPIGPWGTKGIAIAVIIFHTLLNLRGVKHGSELQSFFTIGKVLAILLIIVLGLIFGSQLPNHFELGDVQQGSVHFNQWISAIIAGTFAFGGWHLVTYNAGETINPKSTIPKALFIGIIIVTLSYIGMNALYFYIMPLEQVASSTKIAADAADILFGKGGAVLMASLVLFSTFGAISGIILSGPRVYYAMAKDFHPLKWIAKLHPRFNTPSKAIYLQALWSSVLVLTGTYSTLFSRVIYTEWMFFGLMAVGLMLLRRRKDIQREYRIWAYPWTPLIFAGFSFFIVIHRVVIDPYESLLGLILILSGIAVYYIFKLNKIVPDDH